jgi:hypothetical protein
VVRLGSLVEVDHGVECPAAAYPGVERLRGCRPHSDPPYFVVIMKDGAIYKQTIH